MVGKKCPKCNKISYSAAEMGNWICPYCGNNLKDIPAQEKKDMRGDKLNGPDKQKV